MTDVKTGGDETTTGVPETTGADEGTTEEDGTTTGVSETIGTAGVSNAARSTITTGRARSARTPISLSETSATGAKHHDRVAVVDDGTTEEDVTTTGVSETTEADEGTTVKDGTTTEDSETIGMAGVSNAEPTTTTTGHAPSVRTPISPSERSATGAKHRDRVAAVAAEAVVEDNTETTVAQAMEISEMTAAEEATEISGEMENEDANKAVEAVVVASKIAVHPMFNPAEPKESVLVMLTINLPEISDLRGNLNAETTERM